MPTQVGAAHVRCIIWLKKSAESSSSDRCDHMIPQAKWGLFRQRTLINLETMEMVKSECTWHMAARTDMPSGPRNTVTSGASRTAGRQRRIPGVAAGTASTACSRRGLGAARCPRLHSCMLLTETSAVKHVLISRKSEMWRFITGPSEWDCNKASYTHNGTVTLRSDFHPHWKQVPMRNTLQMSLFFLNEVTFLFIF